MIRKKQDDKQHIKPITEGIGDQGVVVKPTPITSKSKIKVMYSGLLMKNGADALWAHAGYGKNNAWKSSQYLQMQNKGDIYELDFEVKGASRLNLCFKDSANNWDNNNGLNWSYEIHNGDLS